MKDKAFEVENLSFEEAYAELEKIVEALETSNTSLADSLTLFEKGQFYLKHCNQLLQEADIKLQTLSDMPESDKSGSNA